MTLQSLFRGARTLQRDAQQQRPFSWAPRFWERISKRSQILRDDKRSCARVSRRPRTPPKTPPVDRRGTKQCLPSYAELLPQEETYASGSVAQTEGVSPTGALQDSANVNPVCEKSFTESETSKHPERMRQRRIVHSPPRRPPAKIRKLSVHGIDQPQLAQEDLIHSSGSPPPEKCRGWLGSDWAPVTPRWEDVVWTDPGAWIPNTPAPLPCMTPCPESSLPGLTAKAKSVSASVRPPVPKALFPPLPSELTFAPAEIVD